MNDEVMTISAMGTDNTEKVTADTKSACDINTSETAEKQEKEEKVFTQSQVDALINERIKRERKVNEALLPVKELLKNACSKGLVKGKSYTEMAQDFIAKLKEAQTSADGNLTQENGAVSCENNLADSVNAAVTNRDTPQQLCGENNSECLVAERQDEEHNEKSEYDGKAENDIKAEYDGKAENDGVGKEIKSDGTVTVKDICALKEKYPNVDMNRLFDNRMFESFAKGKNANVLEIYDDFCSFLGLLQQTSSEKTDISENDGCDTQYRNGEKAVYSTAISSQSGVCADFSDGLTKQQMDIAKSAGMSYREYAYLLSSIPKGKIRN